MKGNFTLTPNEIQIRQRNLKIGANCRDCEYAVGVLFAQLSISKQVSAKVFNGEEAEPLSPKLGELNQEDYEAWGYEISDAWLALEAYIDELKEEIEQYKTAGVAWAKEQIETAAAVDRQEEGVRDE